MQRTEGTKTSESNRCSIETKRIRIVVSLALDKWPHLRTKFYPARPFIRIDVHADKKGTSGSPPPIFSRAWTRVICVSVRLSNTNDLPRPRGVAVKPVKRVSERENTAKLTINLPSAVAKQLELFATVYFPALPSPSALIPPRSTEGNNSGSHPVSKVTSCIQRALVGRKSRWKYCHALRELRREP